MATSSSSQQPPAIPAIVVRRGVAPAGEPGSQETESSTTSSVAARPAEAFFGFRLRAAGQLDHASRIDGQALLLARLGSGSDLPGWSRAIEVRYVVRPADPVAGTDESVECFLLGRLSSWTASPRQLRAAAERFVTSLLDVVEASLPALRFVALDDPRALERALHPFRARDLVEIRRPVRALAASVASSSASHSLALPLQGVPDASGLVELLLRQRSPSVLSCCVMPLPESGDEPLFDGEDERVAVPAPVRGSPTQLPSRDEQDGDEVSYESLAAAYEDLSRHREHAQRLTALHMAQFHLRISLAAPAALSEAAVNTLAREVGGPGRLTAAMAWRHPSLPLAAGALCERPRSARLPQNARVEFATAWENVRRLGFTPWSRDGSSAPYVADLGEVARCFALPVDAPWLPEQGMALALPFRAAVPEGIGLGVNRVGGVVSPVRLPLASRPFHTWVLGVTGSGKTTLLERMILDDIRAGRGVIVVDPHGDLIRHLAGRIPPERVKDVILFDPADKEFPLSINPLEVADEDEHEMVVNAFIDLLIKLYDPQHTGIIGPRFEHGARNVMLTVMATPGNTLVEVLRAFQDDDFATKVLLPNVTDPLVKRYWTDQIQNTNSFHRSEVLDWLVSKFSHFVTDRTMRRILGQSKSSFTFREAMDSGKIVLVSLAKGLLGAENANFLGLILLPMVLRAALSRADLPEHERRDVALYIDEFQNYATDSLALMMAEARKYHVALTLANQHVGQLTGEIRDAIIGNVGSLIAFRLGAIDATAMEAMLAPSGVHAQDIVNLPDHTAYARLLIRGRRCPAFTLETEQITLPWDDTRLAAVREYTRAHYARVRSEVEAEIRARSLMDEAKKPAFPNGFHTLFAQ